MKPYDATEMAYKNGYADAAKEIFEEIEEILADEKVDRLLERRGFCFIYKNKKTIEQRFAELKKKYTEENLND